MLREIEVLLDIALGCPRPSGKERMRRLIEIVRSGQVDLSPLLTHPFSLDQISDAYDLFGNHRDGVLKVAIRP